MLNTGLKIEAETKFGINRPCPWRRGRVAGKPWIGVDIQPHVGQRVSQGLGTAKGQRIGDMLLPRLSDPPRAIETDCIVGVEQPPLDLGQRKAVAGETWGMLYHRIIT